MTRNVYLLLLSCLLLINAEGFGQGNSKKNGNNGNGNGPKEEKSVFPPYGNTGIGIRYPTEKLEVIGNAKISQTLMANELKVLGIRGTTLTLSEDATIGRNLLVNGNVGIGIAVPTEKLDIGGNLRVSNTIFSDQVSTVGLSSVTGAFSGRLTASENVVISGLTGMGVSDPVERLEVAGNIKASGFVSADQINTIGTSTSTLHVDETVKVQGEAIFDTRIGIGISAPTEALDVAGNIRALGDLTANATNTQTMNAGTATVSDALNVNGTTQTNVLEASEFNVATQTAGSIRTTQLMVNTERIPEGFVMAVDGNMLATRVEVFAPENWPDYVFSDNYRLRTLTEVEQYIKKHGHLPNVPSAEKMQQGGYSLSQMDANLLEKIEELTLYMIELKKENEALKSQLEQLNNK